MRVFKLVKGDFKKVTKKIDILHSTIFYLYVYSEPEAETEKS